MFNLQRGGHSARGESQSEVVYLQKEAPVTFRQPDNEKASFH